MLEKLRSVYTPFDFGLLLLTALFAVEVFGWIVFNCTRIPYVIDYDGSVPVMQALEIARQKKLLIDNWSYQTTLGLDSPVLLAALIMLIVNNPCLAYGIADSIVILVTLLVVNDIYHYAHIKPKYRLIGMCLLIAPYSYYGGLAWDAIILTGPSFYSVKLLLVFLCTDSCLRLRAGLLKNPVTISLAALSMIVALASGFSSGLYLLVAGIAALMLAELVMYIANNEPVKHGLVVFGYLIAVAFIIVMGNALAIRTGFVSMSNTKTLLPFSDLAENAHLCLIGLFQYLGGFGSEVAVISPEGIARVASLIIASAVLVTLIAEAVFMIARRETNFFLIWSVMAFLVNMFILCTVSTRYGGSVFEVRYHSFTLIPAMITSAWAFERLAVNKRADNAQILGAFLALACIAAINAPIAFAKDSGFDTFKNLIAEANNEGANGVVFYADPESTADLIIKGRVARLCDPSIPVVASDSWGTPYRWGADQRWITDFPNIDGKYAVVTDQIGYDHCTAEDKESWRLLDEIEAGLQLYLITDEQESDETNTIDTI